MSSSVSDPFFADRISVRYVQGFTSERDKLCHYILHCSLYQNSNNGSAIRMAKGQCESISASWQNQTGQYCGLPIFITSYFCLTNKNICIFLIHWKNYVDQNMLNYLYGNTDEDFAKKMSWDSLGSLSWNWLKKQQLWKWFCTMWLFSHESMCMKS